VKRRREQGGKKKPERYMRVLDHPIALKGPVPIHEERKADRGRSKIKLMIREIFILDQGEFCSAVHCKSSDDGEGKK